MMVPLKNYRPSQSHSDQFIDPNESILETLMKVKPSFIPFRKLIPDYKCKSPREEEFLDTTLIMPRPSTQAQEVTITSADNNFDDILDNHLNDLLSRSDENYVQTAGYTRGKNRVVLQFFTESNRILKTSMLRQLADEGLLQLVKSVLYNYTVLVKERGSYVQIIGPPIYNYLNYKNAPVAPGKKLIATSLLTDDFYLKKNMIKRRFILYCSNMLRTPGLWRSNAYFQKGCKPMKEKYAENELELLINKAYSGLGLHQRLDQVEISFVIQLLEEHFRKVRELTRVRKVKVKEKIHSRTNFGWLLYTNCDLPENYKSLKNRVEQRAKLTPKQIQDLFNDLYASVTECSDVCRMFNKILQRTIPDRLFGYTNKRILKTVVSEWISMNRFEDFRIQDIMLRIDHNSDQIRWFTRRSATWMVAVKQRKKKVLASIICFIFNSLIIPLISANFYVTEKHKEGSKLFYYRKPIWVLISGLSIAKFQNKNLRRIHPNTNIRSLQRIYDLPCGKLRILPKKGSFRPIITFNSKRTTKGKSSLNLNQLLLNVKIILRGLKNILGKDFGHCVFDNEQIFRKYDQFFRRWQDRGQPQVCYFALDIQKCYDSIDPKRLVRFIQQCPYLKDYYIIHKYIKIFRNKKPVAWGDQMVSCFNVKERVTAQSMEEELFAINEPDKLAIYIYTSQSVCMTRKQLVRQLTTVCQRSVIMYKDRKWIQSFGIPQGLNISGVLCSLYFAMIEASVKVNNGLLMRLTDDYIFLGEKEEADRVLAELMQIEKQNSFIFNQAKIKGNYDNPHISKKVVDSQIEWIGKKFDLKTLEYFPQQEPDKQKLKYAMNVNYFQASKPQFYHRKYTSRILRSHLKNKFKSLLTNHLYFYFKPSLFNFNNLLKHIRMFVRLSLYKFQPWLDGLTRFGLQDTVNLTYMVIKGGLEAFVKFACSLFPPNCYNTECYNSIMRQTLGVVNTYCLREDPFKKLGLRIDELFRSRLEQLLHENDFFQSKCNENYFLGRI